LRSKVVFSEVFPHRETGISTDALLRIIDAMIGFQSFASVQPGIQSQ